MFISDGLFILFYCLLSMRSVKFHMFLGFFDDSALQRREFFLSLIVFLYCFWSSSYFWCFLLSHSSIRDNSNFWWSLMTVSFFIHGAIGWVNFRRLVGAWLSIQSVKSLKLVSDLQVLQIHILGLEIVYWNHWHIGSY